MLTNPQPSVRSPQLSTSVFFASESEHVPYARTLEMHLPYSKYNAAKATGASLWL